LRVAHHVSVVTGGASGLGLATARRLVAEGGRVAIIDVDADTTQAAAATQGLSAFPADISDAVGVETIFEAIEKQLGPVRILVNCAGIATPGPVIRRGAAMPLDEFQRVVEINLLGTINAIRCAVPQMVRAGRDGEEAGVIVNTASIAAFDGQVGQAAYSASKGGIAAMSLPLARELGDLAIRVMAIAPGVFDTPMTQGLPDKSRDVVFGAVPPFPKRPGRPEEFADLVATIIAQPMLNGSTIRLDGGLRMPARL
jgi:NAD(P)-dependent dehydrogenase (short-subunit alcohol dehydrogenase family)